jgi:hypothetical protein
VVFTSTPMGLAKLWPAVGSSIPSTLYLEARSTGAINLTLKLLTPGMTTAVDQDAVVFTALAIDLDTDSDNTGTIERSAIEEADEMLPPGKIIRRNHDDDNGNGNADYDDPAPFVDANNNPVLDDDLKPLVMSIANAGQDLTGFTVSFAPSSSAIKLWKTQDKQALLSVFTIGTHAVPDTIYVEGVDYAQPSVQVTLRDVAGAVIHLDKVLISVVNLDAVPYRPQTPPPASASAATATTTTAY